MRRLLLSACATMLLFAGTTVSKASIVVTEVNGLGSFDFNVLFQGPNQNGIITGIGNGPPQPTLINFSTTSPNVSLLTSGNGQAAVASNASTGTFNELSFTATDGGFSRLLLNLGVPNNSNESVSFTFNDQFGPVTLPPNMDREKSVFSESTSLIFKNTKVVRMFDAKRNTLVYVAISKRVLEGSPMNAISAVPIIPWTGR